MGQMEKYLSAITAWKEYLEMATDGPLPQKILAKSWSICHIRTRPSFRSIIAATNALLLTPFPSCYQGG